ncbi:MAG: PadR family transcriptional regulator [Gemmatimonadetes bacterium]|nr:PadR family transcriptional regulator [Gemmatimonadota bacterium]
MDVLRGTLDLMILKALSHGEMHGYGLTQWIRTTTDEALSIEDGALYPALHRLEDRGWILAEWGTSENNRRAKYYSLTAKGRRQLGKEIATWSAFSAALRKIVESGEA